MMHHRLAGILAVALVAALPGAGIRPARSDDSITRVIPTERRPLTVQEAKALIGQAARSRDGQTAGTVHDFALDGPEGRIERVILANGGFLGFGVTLTAVPVEALRVDAHHALTGNDEGVGVTIDLDFADLKRAPKFTYGKGRPTLVERN